VLRPQTNRYGYQGEYAECDPETATTTGSESIGGWNSFDLRMYDANVGRWLSRDPKKQFWSPYEGMGNNPANLNDPDGGGTTDWGARTEADGTTTLKWFGQGVKVPDGWKTVSKNFNYFTRDDVQHPMPDQTKYNVVFEDNTLKDKGYIINSSDHPIFFYPETTLTYEGVTYNAGESITINPGQSSPIPADVVYAPFTRNGAVFKIVSGNKVVVTNNGVFVYKHSDDYFQSSGQDLKGGWYPGTFFDIPDAFQNIFTNPSTKGVPLTSE